MNLKIKKPKIFYGWYVLAIGMFGAFMGAAISQLFMSTMLKPLTEEFRWSRTTATGAITTGTIMAGLFSFPFGKLADRYGPRLLSSLGAFVITCTYVVITKFADLWQFYVVFVIARVVTANTLSSIVPQTAAVNCFRRFRGRALGLLSMATPLGASVLAFVAQLIMERHGWRTVFMSFALVMVFLQAIPAALVLRRRPEDLGLVPDGVKSKRVALASTDPPLAQGEVPWTLGEAIRTRTLWLLIAAIIHSLVGHRGGKERWLILSWRNTMGEGPMVPSVGLFILSICLDYVLALSFVRFVSILPVPINCFLVSL